MKRKFILAIALIGLGMSSMAQKKTSGAIQYQVTVDPAAIAAASGMTISPEMLARMPKASKIDYELLFNATHASYMLVQDFEDSNTEGGGMGGGMNMGRMMGRFGGNANRDYYYNIPEKKMYEVFTLNDSIFVMPGELKLNLGGNNSGFGGNNQSRPQGQQGGQNQNAGQNRPNNQNNSAVQYSNEPPVIKVIKTDETKTLLGLNAKKAVVTSTRKATVLGMEKEVTEETVIWYTNDLGFDFSPNPNIWTEGAVLSIEAKGNSTIAKSIEYRNVNAKDVNPPKKAIALTKEEYAAKMESMMRRMRNNQGGERGAGGNQGNVRNIVIN